MVSGVYWTLLLLLLLVWLNVEFTEVVPTKWTRDEDGRGSIVDLTSHVWVRMAPVVVD